MYCLTIDQNKEHICPEVNITQVSRNAEKKAIVRIQSISAINASQIYLHYCKYSPQVLMILVYYINDCESNK